MYHTIAPTIASKGYTVLVPDLPGMGQSIHSSRAQLTARNASIALHKMLTFLRITQIHLFAYDVGTGAGVLLARDHPDLVKTLVVAEYALPGYGLEHFLQPGPDKTFAHSWHLSLFSVPEAATFLIRGREEQFLSWYFWHGAYSGLHAVDPVHFRRYVQEWQRPRGLEAGVETLGGAMWVDGVDISGVKVKCRMSVVGGEAQLGRQEGLMERAWGNVSEGRLECVVVPKCGHWIGDENPLWVAKYLAEWCGRFDGEVADADLGWLDGKVTLQD